MKRLFLVVSLVVVGFVLLNGCEMSIGHLPLPAINLQFEEVWDQEEFAYFIQCTAYLDPPTEGSVT